jgi:anti-sigma factor RsiW
MKIERFEQLVRAYGADPALWPAGERDAAQQLLASSAEAQRLVERERRLDQLLFSSPAPVASAALLDRIVANATAQPQVRSAPKPAPRRWFAIDLGFGRLWQQAAGLAACALLGFFVGSSGVLDISPSDAGEIAALMSDDLPFDGSGL